MHVVASMKADDSNRQIGMRILVTLNLATKADLANGSTGLIQDIVLDPKRNSL